jgi:hypothetical protein
VIVLGYLHVEEVEELLLDLHKPTGRCQSRDALSRSDTRDA